MSNPSKPNTPQTGGISQQAGPSTSSGADGISSKSKAPKRSAAEEATDVARDAQAIASQVAGKAREGLSDAKEQLRNTAEEQKDAGADRIKHIAGAVRRAADELEQEIPQAAHYVRRAAKELENVSEAVQRRDVYELADVVQDFARRQPTAFLGASVLAGFAAVRFLKTSAEGRSSVSTAHRGGGQGLGAVPTAHQRSTAAPSGHTSAPQASDALKPTPAPGIGSTSSPSGDPGGVAPEAPGFAAKPAGPGPSGT